ncbi:Hypothetical_protein [Hexamita inflata]|uniref:Hypothetical_protein n=1 Tax=Hexamita inflata TaxID=28002 RepID=A0ABP1HZL5_9EUKA
MEHWLDRPRFSTKSQLFVQYNMFKICVCQQQKEVDTLNFFLKLKSQSSSPLMKQQLSQDGQCYYVPAWVLCFKTRVKSKIRSCNFSQFSKKQIFGKQKFCRRKLKGNFKVVDMELMEVRTEGSCKNKFNKRSKI